MGILMKNGVNYSGGLIEVKPEIYSEDEREIGVWIDGKPVYEKTIRYDGEISTGIRTVPHGISNLGTVVNIFGIINHSTITPYGETFPSKDSSMGRVSVKTTNIEINTNGSWEGYIFYITLQYTKTTDTPGSGLWSTTGAPAHHYSQNEQIVGTWIDNKPIYEKVIQWHGVGGSGTITTKELGAPAESIISLNVLCVYPAGTNNTYYFDGPWWATGNKPIVRYCMHNDNSTWYVQVDVSESGAQNCDFTAIVRYTKTTD